MNAQYWFTLFAISQGAFVLGLTVFIFWHYMPKKNSELKDPLRWHIISVATSYILLTIATIGSAAYNLYNWGDAWYWIVAFAYIIGDVSLIIVFRRSVKKKC